MDFEKLCKEKIVKITEDGVIRFNVSDIDDIYITKERFKKRVQEEIIDKN